MNWKWVLAASAFLMSCTARKNFKPGENSQLRFVGGYSIPLKQQYKGTTIGGLSGIDYDVKNDIYYLISDDGSKINPARFYTAKIKLSTTAIDTVEWLNVTTLMQAKDSPYPYSAIDPEAVRYHPVRQQLFWSSEGEKIIKPGGIILHQPSVNISGLDGKLLDSFSLPVKLQMHNEEKGPRSNGSFEGLAFSKNYKTMYVNIEEPLYEDGPKAGTGDSSAWTRLLQFDVASKKMIAQYAYRIDPVAYMPSPPGAFKINGASEIMWINKDQLLVLERSFSTGRKGCVIKVYLADLSKATDVTNIESLQQQVNFRPASKKLLYTMEELGIPVYNIEGVTFGPQLPNGNQSLLFVADDNFSENDKTQFLFFEIMPTAKK